jgi:DNA-binding MarR family transcriptional regulator
MSEREMLAGNLRQFRQAIWHDLLMGMVRLFGDADFSLAQVATLYLLDGEEALSVKSVSERIGRSLSATSRMVEQLVERGLVERREDQQDRRMKRVLITAQGRAFLRTFEQNRADAQLTVMMYLSPEEQARVNEAMELLAEAARRRAERHEQTGTGAGDE